MPATPFRRSNTPISPRFSAAISRPRSSLPPIDTVSLSGLGFVQPYALLATIASALRPKKIFEIGTFRGVSTLTFA